VDEKTKKAYIKPELRVIGNVPELTQGSLIGDYLDADYPAGTPRGRLGFTS